MIDTGQTAKVMYVPVRQNFGELEILAIAPIQATREDCERLKLDYIRQKIEQKTAGELLEWELAFLQALKAGDDEAAWAQASYQGASDGCCAYEHLLEANLHVIEVLVPA